MPELSTGDSSGVEGPNMVVRLQTSEGKIKEYRTTYGVGDNGSENNPRPEKYVSPCGKEWEFQPKPNEECHHLNCAIYLAKKERDYAPIVFVLLIVVAVILLFINFAIAGITFLAGVVFFKAIPACYTHRAPGGSYPGA